MQRCIAVRISVTFVAAALLAFAHGGGIDAYGGHNDRRSGTYHFHHGPLAGKHFDSKAEAIAALNAVRSPAKEREEARSPNRALKDIASEDRNVFVTRTGKKYHAASCSSLRLSSIRMKLNEAEDAGYSPCLRCGGGKRE